MQDLKNNSRLARARWPMLAFVVALVTVALTWIWQFTETQRQDKHLRTLLVLFVGYALFLGWVVFFSGWRKRARWTVLLGTVALIAAGASTLRIRGVTGDLIPIVEWRWTRHATRLAVASTNVPAATVVSTNDFPQFLGPARNGILPGPILDTNWSLHPPQVVWRQPIGAAWSGFAIAVGRAITQEQQGQEELVTCFDLTSGQLIWKHSDSSRYATTIAGEGPRATPTIVSNRVFTMGGRGVLSCLDLHDGKVIWHHDTLAEHDARLPEWGVACSPLVTDRAVIVTVGGRNSAMVAYDRETGAQMWASGNDSPHWCSPTRAVLFGTPQALVFSENVSAYDEATGKVLWQYPWRSAFPHVTTPALVGTNRVLVSQGYGGGSELLEIKHEGAHWKATRVWKSIRLKSKFAPLIIRGGYVYGLDDGALVCVDLQNGDLKWKGDRYGHGQLLLVRDLLLITAETGEIVLVEPNPAEPRELSRFKMFSAKTWNLPALAGDLLLVRNDQEAACLRLPLAR